MYSTCTVVCFRAYGVPLLTVYIAVSYSVRCKGVGPGPTLAWPGWKQPDIPVEVDTDRLETSRSEAGVLKKLSIAGIGKLSRLKYR